MIAKYRKYTFIVKWKISYKNLNNLNFQRKKSLKDKTEGIIHYASKEEKNMNAAWSNIHEEIKQQIQRQLIRETGSNRL